MSNPYAARPIKLIMPEKPRMNPVAVILIAVALLLLPAGCTTNHGPARNVLPTGKIAARPLYRDPVFDHATDPVVVYNPESKRWLMYYTQRRGGSIALVHGSKIGIAASKDGGATWKYIGTAGITYGQDKYPTNYTYWAPDVIWSNGQYHMFLAFVPGIFNDWNHPREIVHLTSRDGIKWETVGKLDLNSNKVIDPCVIHLPNGDWRMFYKDEARQHNVCYADSPDLYHWETRGNAVTDRNGEGENCIRFKGKYWLLADTDRPVGQAVWSSDDCTHWTPQAGTIYGSHGDMVVSGGRAWWFYFGGQRVDHVNWAVVPATNPAYAFTDPPSNERSSRHGLAINVVELKVIDGKLMFTSPNQPTYIDLKPVREKKSDVP